MQVHTLDTSTIINELQLGNSVNHAINQARRADFALMLAMVSDDIQEQMVPLSDTAKEHATTYQSDLTIGSRGTLTSEEESYYRSASIANAFHQGGLTSAKLQFYTRPDSLAYLPEDTAGLNEEVYHNLSAHQRRKLKAQETVAQPESGLLDSLIVARRIDAMCKTVNTSA